MPLPVYDHLCPGCDSRVNAVPVWESNEAFQAGEEPDYIGCTDCRAMVPKDGPPADVVLCADCGGMVGEGYPHSPDCSLRGEFLPGGEVGQ